MKRITAVLIGAGGRGEGVIRPFVEFGFFPKDMALDEKSVFWWKGHVLFYRPGGEFEG